MTNLNSRLDEIQGRVDAATEGPWMVSPHMDYTDEENPTLDFYAIGPDDDEAHIIDADPWHEADATFIAHARTDVPALLAAVRAVVELHVPDERVGLHCQGCDQEWPCGTWTAVTEALGVES